MALTGTPSPSSIRPPATPEAEKIVELDAKANTGETKEQRAERETEQRSAYDQLVANARAQAEQPVVSDDEPEPEPETPQF